MSKGNKLCFQNIIDLKQQNPHDVAPLILIEMVKLIEESSLL